jgi:hypothetical protein
MQLFSDIQDFWKRLATWQFLFAFHQNGSSYESICNARCKADSLRLLFLAQACDVEKPVFIGSE